MAIDLGLGALTYATEDGTIAKVQIAPSADTDHRAVRKLQRAMERSRQATNPDNYETVEVVEAQVSEGEVRKASVAFLEALRKTPVGTCGDASSLRRHAKTRAR